MIRRDPAIGQNASLTADGRPVQIRAVGGGFTTAAVAWGVSGTIRRVLGSIRPRIEDHRQPCLCFMFIA
jgi:hypothetical protein